MNENGQQGNAIRQIIDARLSGMYENPNLEMNVLQQVRGEIKVKKKISVGLVLALVLILLTLTALAVALLTPRDITEQYGIPMANQSEGDSYSVEETNILLDLAKENGITLSDNAMASINKDLSNGIGYYKEEMLMALAKAEFGDDPGAWTLEEQKWFDDVCVTIGFVKQPQKALPGVDEIKQEQAVQIAEDYIHENFEKSVKLNDSTFYSKSIQHIDGAADGEYPGLYWSISYEPLNVTATEYWIYISSQGEVWGYHVQPGVEKGTQVDMIRSRFTDVYGWNMAAWSISELQVFRDTVVRCAPNIDRAVECLIRTEYPDLSKNSMEPEEAGKIAAKSLALSDYRLESSVYIGDSPNPIWKVCLYVLIPDGEYDKSDPFAGYAYYYVEVDSITGEVKNTYKRQNGYDYWYHDFVLEKVIEEVDATWDDSRFSVG